MALIFVGKASIEGDFVNCLECKEKIKVGASTCPHCGHYQSWKRHITSFNLFLSLLIAFFSVLGIVLPIIKQAIFTERANLKMAIASSTFNNFEFLISNLGNRSAVVTKVSVKYDDEDSHFFHMLYPDILGKVIEPNRTYTVQAMIKDNQQIPIIAPPLLGAYNPEMWDTCYLQIQLIHFDGAIENPKLPFKCAIPKEAN